MKLLLDMNISPMLVDLLRHHQVDAMHWCMLGKYDVADVEGCGYYRLPNHKTTLVREPQCNPQNAT